MSAGRRADKKSTAKPPIQRQRPKRPLVQVLRWLPSSTMWQKCENRSTVLRSSTTAASRVRQKKKHDGSKLACLLPWYSRHVWCHSNAIATKKGKASSPWHCGASMLTKKELVRRRERSGRTVLALLCVSCQMKNFKSLANWSIFAAPGNRQYCSAGVFFRGFGSWLTCRRDRRCGMVFRCLRKSARRVENSIFPLYWSRLCGEDRHCTQKKPNLAGNRDGARLYFLLSSTFLWCCNFQISALERTLSGCLLSISIDFTPFPVKLISARTGIRMYTCHCISPNDKVLKLSFKPVFFFHPKETCFSRSCNRWQPAGNKMVFDGQTRSGETRL